VAKAYSTVNALDRVKPRETFADGVCDAAMEIFPEKVVSVPRVTVNAAEGSDSGFMESSSSAQGLKY
jgi:hypothetical protein